MIDRQFRRRMPVVFGPSPSPRQDANGRPWSNPFADITAYSVSFLTDRDALAALTPRGVQLDGEPVVTVETMYITNLQWLAGRGYNTIGVRFPVQCKANGKSYRGNFLSILWENLTDPILTGREELGFAKLYCDIASPAPSGDGLRIEAAWQGHTFLDVSVSNLVHAAVPAATGDGLLHQFSIPRIGAVGEYYEQGLALSPNSPGTEIRSYETGEGAAHFLPSTWEQLPTMAHIVGALAGLPMIKARGATRVVLRSDTSLHNQTVLTREPYP